MQALLTAIVVWLSASFDLPARYDVPRVEFVPVAQMIAQRYKSLLPAERANIANALGDTTGSDTVALYNDDTKTIYLPDGWAGHTPAELSILVHEMVHHLQNIARLAHECPQAREKLAYEAQDKWLALFDTSLEREFGVDGFTLLAKTVCLG
jgi:hypothetical protein